MKTTIEGDAYWPTLKSPVSRGRITGPAMYDARVAALCGHHGVRGRLTADRVFSRLASVSARNPLAEGER